MSQMTQQMSQMSQSYTSTQQQSSNEVYESTQMGGITKGYRRKDDDELAAERDMTRNSQQFIQDNGIFGGITGDHNSLLQDSQFDSKKHSVKDLAGHFAKLRPKAEIPVQYLPEQKMFNGQQGPSLNYLNSNSSSSSQQSTLTRSTTSKQDSNASRQEYEMRKAQSNQNNTEQSSSSSSVAQSSSVEMRSKTEASTQQKKLLSERRQSLKDYMLMDPAAIHASAGIIDPSAILRGDQSSNWNLSDTSSHTSVRSITASPSSKMYISKPSGPRPFGQTLPRSFKPVSSQAISQPMSSYSPVIVPSDPQQLVSQLPPQPPATSQPPQIFFRPPSAQMVSQPENVAQAFENAPQIIENASHSSENASQVSEKIPQCLESSSQPIPTALLIPSPEPEYQATVQTSSTHFSSLSSQPITQPNQATGQPLNTTNTHENSVIQTSLKTLDQIADLQPAVSLSLPDLPRSTASTPLPTLPFPPLDVHTNTSSLRPFLATSASSSTINTLLTNSSSLLQTSSTSTSSLLTRPRTPILVTTRPSSVNSRSRHMSKDDIARMMAEINAPLPPMVPLPQDIRASPLIFFPSAVPGNSVGAGPKL